LGGDCDKGKLGGEKENIIKEPLLWKGGREKGMPKMEEVAGTKPNPLETNEQNRGKEKGGDLGGRGKKNKILKKKVEN